MKHANDGSTFLFEEIFALVWDFFLVVLLVSFCLVAIQFTLQRIRRSRHQKQLSPMKRPLQKQGLEEYRVNGDVSLSVDMASTVATANEKTFANLEQEVIELRRMQSQIRSQLVDLQSMIQQRNAQELGNSTTEKATNERTKID